MHLGPPIYGGGDQGAIQITTIAQQVGNLNACVQIIAEEEQRRYKKLTEQQAEARSVQTCNER